MLDNRSRDDIESTIRAGVLEQGTVDRLARSALASACGARGRFTTASNCASPVAAIASIFPSSPGKAITVYAQHEVIKDLVAARLGSGATIVFDAEAVSVHDLDRTAAVIRYRHAGSTEGTP